MLLSNLICCCVVVPTITMIRVITLAAVIATCFAAITHDERTFMNVPDAETALKNLLFITSVPHVAGTKEVRREQERRGA